jgi:predicted transcriptional regulator
MTVLQLEVPDEITQRVDALARHAGQSPEQLILEVLADYLAQIAEEDARLEAAMAAADRGDVVDAEVVRAEDEAYLLSRGMTREQLDAIGEEVRREYDAFYGVSLCE